MDIQDINIVKKLHVEEFAQELAFVPWLHLPSNVMVATLSARIVGSSSTQKGREKSYNQISDMLIEWNDASKG